MGILKAAWGAELSKSADKSGAVDLTFANASSFPCLIPHFW